ncbi:MAG: molybdenum cofactor guanylyltransferase [Anaerolineales bacterium]|nr:molybdenum cofactor guanylyltransferase [Anaerolineales bacterium]
MPSLVIQAGGQSKRMGQDKGLVSFLGMPLVQRVIERLAYLAEEILITTNQPENYRFLGYRLVRDLLPGRGALGGLYTALSVTTSPLVAVVACDMPFASPQLLTAEINILSQGTYDAAIPNPDDGMEPFHAVYRRQTCLPAIKAALDADQWRADSWFSQVNVHLLSKEEIHRYDPTELAFWNVNTPEELSRAEERAKTL